jgi:hypothetical protein
MRSGWDCKAAADVLHIPTTNVTRQVWPHFRTIVRLIERRPYRALATMAAAMCQLAEQPIPTEFLELAWRPNGELDLDDLTLILEAGRGTAKATTFNAYSKVSRLMAANPLLTWIDLAVMSRGEWVDQMGAVELDRRIQMQTGRLPRSQLSRRAP